MQSLAELIQKNKIKARFHDENLELMQQAAQLGNADAQIFMAEYTKKREMEAQGEAIMRGIFQGLIQRVPR